MKKETSRYGRLRILALLLIVVNVVTPIRAEENYTYITKLQSPTPIQGGEFGSDVALSGDRLVVGEIGTQVDGISSAGRAYLFDTDWNLIATLNPNTPKTLAKFSRSVDIKDDILVVCSYRTDVEDTLEAGEVQVYDSSGTPLYTLQSTQPTLKCKFGRELAIGNGVLIIGHCVDYECKGTVAVYDLEQNYLTTLTSDSMREISAGDELDANEEFIFIGPYMRPNYIESVFVFNYNWELVKTLQSPDNDEGTGFGGCVAISGSNFVVGEAGDTVNEHRRAGRAYVYDTDWNLLSTLQSPSPESNAGFGIDACIAGDLVVVGEVKGDVTSGDEGKVYVFDLYGNLLDTIVSPEPETGAQFGCSVLTDGEIVVVSEVGASVGEFTGAGKVHVFQLGDYEVETETDTGGGIPGFPILAILAALVLFYFFRKWIM